MDLAQRLDGVDGIPKLEREMSLSGRLLDRRAHAIWKRTLDTMSAFYRSGEFYGTGFDLRLSSRPLCIREIPNP